MTNWAIEWVDGQKVRREMTAEEAAALQPTPEEALAAERAGMQCSPLQMRRALRLTDRKAAVDAYMAGQTEEVQEVWEYAVVYNRMDPMMIDAIAAMGTPEDGDDLFRLARTL